MKDKEKIDQMLTYALKHEWKPEDELNDRIINQIMKENQNMKQKGLMKKRFVPSMALVAALVLVMSITVFAAAKLLGPGEAANNMGYQELAAIFKSENGIEINETVKKGGYNITLLGIAGGKELANQQAGFEVQTGSSYAVTAIAKEDGTPMPSTSSEAYSEMEFFVSPLIKGLKPWEYNIASMNGSYSAKVIDGVLYWITQCDSVELFADRGLYLCVTDTAFYEKDAYHYDEATGAVSVNEAYQGVNVLFDLPIDEKQADPQQAEAYLKELEQQWNGTEEKKDIPESKEEKLAMQETQQSVKVLDDAMAEIQNQIEAGTLKDYLKDQKVLEGSEKDITESAGTYSYKFQLANGMGGTYDFTKEELVNGAAFTVQSQGSADGREEVFLILIQETGNGTAKGAVYIIQ